MNHCGKNIYLAGLAIRLDRRQTRWVDNACGMFSFLLGVMIHTIFMHTYYNTFSLGAKWWVGFHHWRFMLVPEAFCLFFPAFVVFHAWSLFWEQGWVMMGKKKKKIKVIYSVSFTYPLFICPIITAPPPPTYIYICMQVLQCVQQHIDIGNHPLLLFGII